MAPPSSHLPLTLRLSVRGPLTPLCERGDLGEGFPNKPVLLTHRNLNTDSNYSIITPPEGGLWPSGPQRPKHQSLMWGFYSPAATEGPAGVSPTVRTGPHRLAFPEAHPRAPGVTLLVTVVFIALSSASQLCAVLLWADGPSPKAEPK